MLAVAQPSKAECFSTLSDNTCETFTPFSPLPNSAEVSITGSSLTGTTRIQIGFAAVPGGTYQVSNIRWKVGNGAYTNMVPTMLVSSTTDGANDARYTNIRNIGAAITAGQTLYFAYDLPDAAFPNTTQLAAYVRTNNNGATSGTDPFGTPLLNLSGAAPIRGTLYTFNHEFRVPGPMPILGAAAAFSASRRLRRRIKAAA
ncbi:MAG: hypothetical protein VKN13_00670 [Cyanobacteriota bacterium]|nr:hypothetical protein [Cyanobacteriota bacterium]